MLTDALGPRIDRTPKHYAQMALGAVMGALMELGEVHNEDQFSQEFVDPVAERVGKGEGGDAFYFAFAEAKRASGGEHPNALRASCSIAIAYCIQAIWAYEDGETASAWTYVADGLMAAGAVRSVPLVRGEAISVQKRNGYVGAAEKLAKDQKQQAKAEAKKLWQERRLGGHPKLRTQEQFATEVMRRWPILTSSKVICGWCTKWNKEAKSQPST
jgi:hypothetical protein